MLGTTVDPMKANVESRDVSIANLKLLLASASARGKNTPSIVCLNE